MILQTTEMTKTCTNSKAIKITDASKGKFTMLSWGIRLFKFKIKKEMEKKLKQKNEVKPAESRRILNECERGRNRKSDLRVTISDSDLFFEFFPASFYSCLLALFSMSQIVRKKVDPRIRTLIENGVKLLHRSFFVIVGDRGRDQVVRLYHILNKAQVKTQPSVLWCYKKELGFSRFTLELFQAFALMLISVFYLFCALFCWSHQKKRIKQIKKEIARGHRDPNEEDPFDLFITKTPIRYCYYKESQNILGNTYGMLILQDFEAITPNLLARTIETVEGGGLICLLLNTMKSLKQLYTMSMVGEWARS